MGMHADRALGYLYSISEDGHFKLTEVYANKGDPSYKVVSDLQPGSAGLKYMIHHEDRAIFIIADGDGYIYIYSQN
jgi:hypothetical protein